MFPVVKLALNLASGDEQLDQLCVHRAPSLVLAKESRDQICAYMFFNLALDNEQWDQLCAHWVLSLASGDEMGPHPKLDGHCYPFTLPNLWLQLWQLYRAFTVVFPFTSPRAMSTGGSCIVGCSSSQCLNVVACQSLTSLWAMSMERGSKLEKQGMDIYIVYSLQKLAMMSGSQPSNVQAAFKCCSHGPWSSHQLPRLAVLQVIEHLAQIWSCGLQMVRKRR
mmetsp:Transcript_37075/g.73397  ORF Transcript_37075/g.73397 Transcript_37075/m.73397 type:complete len:222 (+) Transcript_37075:3534-4199(+)